MNSTTFPERPDIPPWDFMAAGAAGAFAALCVKAYEPSLAANSRNVKRNSIKNFFIFCISFIFVLTNTRNS
jgi:hypothetical protein